MQLLVDGEAAPLAAYATTAPAGQSTPLFVDARRHAASQLRLLTADGDVGRFAFLPLRPDSSWHGFLVCASHDARLWRARDRALLTQLADQTLLALENVRLRRAEQRRVEELRVAATQDLLTGLANRRVFLTQLELALGGSERVAVLFIDLDRFKEVNDAHGHQAGDAVLQAVARVLSRAVRPTDLAARLAGDEFTVLMRDLPDAADAHALAERLASLIPLALIRTQPQCPVTASIGVAIGEDGSPTAEELLRRADHAMYAIKRDASREADAAVPTSRRWRDHVPTAP
jgi:diguanylate cyclase (GGDEF)-like protein